MKMNECSEMKTWWRWKLVMMASMVTVMGGCGVMVVEGVNVDSDGGGSCGNYGGCTMVAMVIKLI